MSNHSSHPTLEELSAYSLGQLPQERAVAIDSHISGCHPCCETMIEMSSDDTFVGLLKDARQLNAGGKGNRAVTVADSSHDIPAQLAEHPRYQILGLIGKGGMGDVYKARHCKMERTVALKVINRRLFEKMEAVDRFQREVKAAAQLSHPNIVTAYDADQSGDYHFMVMEYIDGVDLSRTVKDRGALPVTEACDYVRQAAVGLQHAHERGLVHRDIKPHNLMVTKDGTVKILDFGLASLAPEGIADAGTVEACGDLTAAGAIMGTPDFISPEQAKDARKADIRSDIYSLGATLYYLLSGRVPFDDGSVMQKLKSHAQIQPDSLAMLRDDMAEELIAIVSTMMAKDPNERYLTPSEVAKALEAFLQTWRPGETDIREPVLSGGGNMADAGGQAPVTGEMGPDWLLVIARILFAVAFLPTALIGYQWYSFYYSSPEAGTRIPTYMLATLYLSILAGVAHALQRYRSYLRKDHRIYRWTAREALVIAIILIGGFAFFIPKKGSEQKLSTSSSPFLAQFRAAEKITDQNQSDQAFAELAMNAARAGDVLMTKRALSHILSREKESPTQRDCAIALFHLGKHEEAHELAASIYFQPDRDAALLAFVQSGDP